MKTAILVPLFNPVGYESHVNKFHRFANSMQYDFFVVEAVFGGVRIGDDHKGMTVWGDYGNIMWQKEALLNKAVENLPPEYDTICWIDSDIEFTTKDWIEKGQEQLKQYPVVQPFDQLVYLDANDNPIRIISSYARNMHMYRRGAGGACGGVLMARREIFPLIDYCIVGGGDSTMMFSWTKKYLSTVKHRLGQSMSEQITKDQERVMKQTPNGIGFAEGTCRHIWHGDREKRKYFQRWKMLGRYNFQLSDIKKDDNGLWRWVDNERLQKHVYNYFMGREEDEIVDSPRQ